MYASIRSPGTDRDPVVPGEWLARVKREAMPQPIPIRKLRIDERYQVRVAGLSAENLRNVRLSNPASWPPLLVVQQGVLYVVVGGMHRYTVAVERGIATS